MQKCYSILTAHMVAAGLEQRKELYLLTKWKYNYTKLK